MVKVGVVSTPGVRVGVGVFVGVFVAVLVGVGGTGVLVGAGGSPGRGVLVGGAGVLVGGTGVFVGGGGGTGVLVGGPGVNVAVLAGTGVLVGVRVGMGTVWFSLSARTGFEKKASPSMMMAMVSGHRFRIKRARRTSCFDTA